ncbi:chaperonin 10-like protein [Crepidotus variabilis]|uniref:Chaperonin 10-like protein n=1 Tax=Crepidotus variabilis TaxID=179855 RepID=A0A9P6JRX1_9AGAR|nr:chaperonin 10-like protein [Crepidotus variabilis]
MATLQMKALITAEGNTAVVSNVPIPEPAPNEIRVRVHAVALNPVDALYVAHPPGPPGRVVGSDVAGTVEKVGEQISQWKVGDRVAGLLQGATTSTDRPGGFAEYAVLEEDLTMRIPDKVSFEEAATYPLCSLTAAQALFIRLQLPSPFAIPSTFSLNPVSETHVPSILVYSGSTSIGLFGISLAKLLRTPLGHPYRIFATASPANHTKLLDLGVEAVFDYRSPSWPEDLRSETGGIDYAFDCISEDDSVARISQAFAPSGGKIAVIRKAAWAANGVRTGVLPVYGAAWSGLGREIEYNGETLPASPTWRAFTVAFFEFMSQATLQGHDVFPIAPNPVRLMDGGLERIVQDGFALLGSGKVADRQRIEETNGLRPISGEKLVYSIIPSPVI